MKKLSSGLLLFLFCIGIAAGPLAAQEVDMSAQKAVELVKSKIDIPVDVERFTSNYSEWEGRGRWELSWEAADENLGVSIDVKTGDIVQMHRYRPYRPGEQASILPSVSKEQAQEIALEFLQKAVPSKYNNLRLIKDFRGEGPVPRYGSGYRFGFEREINGIPYVKDGAILEISGKTGRVENFSLRWDYDAVFPGVGDVSGTDSARTAFQKNGAVELMYFGVRNENADVQTKVILVYGVREPRSHLVDARTGQYRDDLVYYEYPLYERGGMGSSEKMQDSAAEPQLSPIEEKEVTALSGIMGREEAVQTAAAAIELPGGFELDSARLYQDRSEPDKRVWSFDWVLAEGEGGYISASVDAVTGELYSFNKWMPTQEDKDQEMKYSIENARQIGDKFISSLQAERFTETKSFEEREVYIKYGEEEPPRVTFHYVRLINQIPYYNDGFSVSVDRVTGEVVGYTMQWSGIKFPSPEGTIGISEASNMLFAVNDLTLGYLRAYRPGEKLPEQAGLYYYFTSEVPRLVDAYTGAVLTDDGKEYAVPQNPSLTDIAGHPAEEDILLLLEMGVVSGRDGSFRPNNTVANAEMVKMLVLVNGWSPGEGPELPGLKDKWYAPYYQTAVFHGLIDADNLPGPNGPVSRISAARFLIDAMGYKKIAQLQGIYKVPAVDGHVVADRDAGYAAISLKLGIMHPVEGAFRPGQDLSRGEAAAALVRYMRTAQR